MASKYRLQLGRLGLVCLLQLDVLAKKNPPAKSPESQMGFLPASRIKMDWMAFFREVNLCIETIITRLVVAF